MLSYGYCTSSYAGHVLIQKAETGDCISAII